MDKTLNINLKDFPIVVVNKWDGDTLDVDLISKDGSDVEFGRDYSKVILPTLLEQIKDDYICFKDKSRDVYISKSVERLYYEVYEYCNTIGFLSLSKRGLKVGETIQLTDNMGFIKFIDKEINGVLEVRIMDSRKHTEWLDVAQFLTLEHIIPKLSINDVITSLKKDYEFQINMHSKTFNIPDFKKTKERLDHITFTPEKDGSVTINCIGVRLEIPSSEIQLDEDDGETLKTFIENLKVRLKRSITLKGMKRSK